MVEVLERQNIEAHSSYPRQDLVLKKETTIINLNSKKSGKISVEYLRNRFPQIISLLEAESVGKLSKEDKQYLEILKQKVFSDLSNSSSNYPKQMYMQTLKPCYIRPRFSTRTDVFCNGCGRTLPYDEDYVEGKCRQPHCRECSFENRDGNSSGLSYYEEHSRGL